MADTKENQTKPSDGNARCGPPTLLLLPGLLQLEVVVPVRVPFMGLIDMIENFSNLIGQCWEK